jgi:lipid-binding SYLF domain-containing protein
MRRSVLIASFLISGTALLADTVQERLGDATAVFSEIMGTPDKGIPQDLLEKAQCVVIVPSLKKGAFVVGGEFGRGFVECRKSGAGWGAPAAIRMEGGSVGFQIGGSSTDVVMLVMNQRGMDRLLSDKFTLGADASVAAGPVGRTAAAETDTRLTAEILAWSRAKGLFAGIALKGATLRPDEKENASLYGHSMTNREILTGNMAPPAAASSLIAELDKYSPRKEGSDSAERKRR